MNIVSTNIKASIMSFLAHSFETFKLHTPDGCLIVLPLVRQEHHQSIFSYLSFPSPFSYLRTVLPPCTIYGTHLYSAFASLCRRSHKRLWCQQFTLLGSWVRILVTASRFHGGWNRVQVRFLVVSLIFLCHKFHSTISPHSSQSFNFISSIPVMVHHACSACILSIHRPAIKGLHLISSLDLFFVGHELRRTVQSFVHLMVNFHLFLINIK